jgi:hypothetical protein
MTQPAYPAARSAAERIHAHFERHLAAAPQARRRAAVPDTRTIEAMIETAFWASLRREEGFIPRISLAFVAPEAVDLPLIFERQLPLAARPLTRLSPAVERPGIHLGVWRDGEQLFVWGATRDLPPFCAVLEVVACGLLVVKHSRESESEKFVNVAVLQGDQVKIINEQSVSLPDCPDLLTSLIGSETQHAVSESVGVLIRLAVSMRAHGPWGFSSRRTSEHRALEGIACTANPIRPNPAILRTSQAGPRARHWGPRPSLGRCDWACCRRRGRPDCSGWRYRDQRPLCSARVWRQNSAPRRLFSGK